MSITKVYPVFLVYTTENNDAVLWNREMDYDAGLLLDLVSLIFLLQHKERVSDKTEDMFICSSEGKSKLNMI